MTGRFPHIALEFMSTFARFEDAMKRAGYLRNRPVAEADWDAFARDLDVSFFEEIRTAAEAKTLVNRPPKARNNQLQWIDGQPVTDTLTLFNALRRARNNLFHGNKYIGDPADDARANQLLAESIWVLNHAISKSDKLQQAING